MLVYLVTHEVTQYFHWPSLQCHISYSIRVCFHGRDIFLSAFSYVICCRPHFCLPPHGLEARGCLGTFFFDIHTCANHFICHSCFLVSTVCWQHTSALVTLSLQWTLDILHKHLRWNTLSFLLWSSSICQVSAVYNNVGITMALFNFIFVLVCESPYFSQYLRVSKKLHFISQFFFSSPYACGKTHPGPEDPILDWVIFLLCLFCLG